MAVTPDQPLDSRPGQTSFTLKDAVILLYRIHGYHIFCDIKVVNLKYIM